MSSVDLVEVFVDPTGPEIIEVMSPGPPGAQGPVGPNGLGFTAITSGTILGNGLGETALPQALNANAVRTILGLSTFDAPTFAGLTLSGLQQFTGTSTVGLRVKSLTSVEYGLLTPANGDLFRDSTTDRIDARLTRGTVELVDTAGGQQINGALTTTGQIRSSANGAASTPATYLTGTWFSGGTGITTKPQLLIEPTGTTSTGWNTNGSAIGVNAASGFLGFLADLKVNNSTLFSVNHQGVVSGSGFTCASGWVYATAGNAFYDSSGTLQRFRIGGTTYFTIATTGVDVVGNLTASGTVTASGTGTHTFGTTNTVTMTAGAISASQGTGVPTLSIANPGNSSPDACARIGTASAGLWVAGANYGVRATAGNAATVPFTARGFASQTANLQEWQNSAGTVLASISPAGNLTASGTITYSSIAFPELVTNGGFDTDTAWTKGAGWSISGGTAVATGVASFADIQQNLPAVNAGQTYVITFTVSITSGTIAAYLGANGNGNSIILIIAASGSYSFLFHKNPLDTTKTILFRGNPTFTGTIDNVSVKRAF